MQILPSSCLIILLAVAHAWMLGATSVASASASTAAPCISEADKASRVGLKSSIFGGFTYGRAAGIAAGTTNPVESCDWQNAVVVHWEILPDKIEELEDHLHLTDIDVSIAPIRLSEQDDDESNNNPSYLLSLSCKQVDVSDQDPRTTNQCDWMLYVNAPESGPEPTHMIIESAYDFEATSPLGLIPQSSLVKVSVDGANDTIMVQVDSANTQFELLLDATLMSPEKVDKDYVHSFDKLYWSNGVYSRLFSDGSLSLAKPFVLKRSDNTADNEDRTCIGKKKKGHKDSGCSKKSGGKKSKSDKSSDDTDTPSAIVILDQTSRWSDFIHQSPYQIMYFPDTITLGAEIWLNAADVDPELFADRADIYSNRATIEAAEITAGLREPIAAFVVETNNVPSYYINFRIRDDKLQDLAAAIPLPDGLTIIPIRMRKNGPLEYIVTLNVYEASGLSPGFRGEWSTFVELDGTPREPHFFVLEAISSTPSFDPVNLFTAPALSIEYNSEMGVLTSSYSLPNDVSYFLSFPMPEPCDLRGQQRRRKASTQHRFTAESKCDELFVEYWVSNDAIYWGNGIYDRGTYDGNAVVAPVSIIDPSLIAVDISNTPWAEFVEPNPSDLLVVQQPLHFLISPMFNVEEIDTCEP